MKTMNTIKFAAMLLTAAAFTSCGTLLTGYDDGYYGNTDVVYTTGGYQTGYDARYAAAYRIAYEEARQQALFLSDKMAYEMNLTPAQYAAVYEINLDYFMSVGGQDDLFSSYWSRRNSDLFYVLTARQYSYFMSVDYFYRPLYWANNYYAYRIYDRYPTRTVFYYSRPSVYDTYRGGYNRSQRSHYEGKFGKRTGNPPASTQVQNGNFGNNSQSANVQQGNVRGNQSNTTQQTTINGNNNQQTTVINNNQTTIINNNGSQSGSATNVTNTQRPNVNRGQPTTVIRPNSGSNSGNASGNTGVTKPSTGNTSVGGTKTNTIQPATTPSTNSNGSRFGGTRTTQPTAKTVNSGVQQRTNTATQQRTATTQQRATTITPQRATTVQQKTATTQQNAANKQPASGSLQKAGTLKNTQGTRLGTTK